MKGRIVLKWIVSVVLMCAVLAGAILSVLPLREWYRCLYERQDLATTTGCSAFEANLNYDGLIQQITGSQTISGMATVESSSDLSGKLLRLRNIYTSCKWLCGLGLLLALSGLLILRNQRWYDCLKWAGLLTLGADALTAACLYGIPSLRAFVFQSRYSEYLGYDAELVRLLPEHWALAMALTGIGAVLIAALLLLWLYALNRRHYRPHRF